MLKRSFVSTGSKSAQSLSEYLMVMAAVIAILFVFLRPGGTYMNSVNEASQITITMMNVTATEIFDDLGTTN